MKATKKELKEATKELSKEAGIEATEEIKFDYESTKPDKEIKNQALILLDGKKKADVNDTDYYRERREAMLWKLVCWKDDGQLQVCGQYQNELGTISQAWRIFNLFNRYWNTFLSLNCMITIELESEDQIMLWKAVTKTYYNLVNENLHFALFHAENSKSYYFMFFDFLQLAEFDVLRRAKARELFTKHFVPFEYYHLVDKGFFHEKKIPLPFAPHWKYGNIFDLIIEYCPATIEVIKKPRIIRKAIKTIIKKDTKPICEIHKHFRKYWSTGGKWICPMCYNEEEKCKNKI